MSHAMSYLLHFIHDQDVDKVKSLAPFEIESSRITVQESTLLGEGEFGR